MYGENAFEIKQLCLGHKLLKKTVRKLKAALMIFELDIIVERKEKTGLKFMNLSRQLENEPL